MEEQATKGEGDILDYIIKRLEEIAKEEGVEQEEQEENPLEEEVSDRTFEACEEAFLYIKERWGCNDMAWCCNWDEKAVEVVLHGENVVVDLADIENLRKIVEKHGLTVKRVEIEVWVDEVAEVTIRFHVELAAHMRLG